MCSVCTASCNGSCEIGLSALRGSEAIYPYATDQNQFASDKKYPLDFSHLTINGRVFGDDKSYPEAHIESYFGKTDPIKLKAPIILPAMAKLNWKDYFAGAALAGVLVVIGEDVIAKDKALILENGKVISSPLLKEMVSAFKQYDHGYGDVIVQANRDDDQLGVLEYAITELGVTSVELKFGQAAKGIQGLSRLKNIEEAIKFHEMGYLIYPDPTDPQVVEKDRNGMGQTFEKIGRLPNWNQYDLVKKVKTLKALGARRVCFKTGPYDSKDLIEILKTASLAGVDLVTFDGAGGGTGNSPVKMMNEWGIPTLQLECMVYEILESLKRLDYDLPQVAITGGIAMEDQAFKAFALGAPYINLIGIGRAAMAAAMVGKQVETFLDAGTVPERFQAFGKTKEELFENYKGLRVLYGERVNDMSLGAIGLYSYIERVTTGFRQLMALNRKYALNELSREDIAPLTEAAESVTGLDNHQKRLKKQLMKLL